MKEKELGRWWAPLQLRPAESFQLAHKLLRLPLRPCFPSEYCPALPPSFKDKRGEQAWAGIIGFLSFCLCHVWGQEQWQGQGGETIQSEIFTCSLQPQLCSFSEHANIGSFVEHLYCKLGHTDTHYKCTDPPSPLFFFFVKDSLDYRASRLPFWQSFSLSSLSHFQSWNRN